MALTFRHGTKLTMIYEGNRYQFLVNATVATQTYTESSQNVKTLHSPKLIERTFSTKKGLVNLSFTVYLSTTGVVERSILDWFNFTDTGGNHIISPLVSNIGTADFYIEAEGTIYRIVNCVGENISFKLSNDTPLNIEVTSQGANMEQVSSIPETGVLVTQVGTRGFYGAPVSVVGYPLLNAITCEITRSIDWAKKQSTHDIGTIFINSTPIVTGLSVSGAITQYKTDDSNDYVPDSTITINYGDTFTIHLDSCNTTDRWAMQGIHMKQIDYKLLPSTTNSYIRF